MVPKKKRPMRRSSLLMALSSIARSSLGACVARTAPRRARLAYACACPQLCGPHFSHAQSTLQPSGQQSQLQSATWSLQHSVHSQLSGQPPSQSHTLHAQSTTALSGVCAAAPPHCPPRAGDGVMRDARWVGVRVVYGILKGKRLCFDRLRETEGKSLSSSRKRIRRALSRGNCTRGARWEEGGGGLTPWLNEAGRGGAPPQPRSGRKTRPAPQKDRTDSSLWRAPPPA